MPQGSLIGPLSFAMYTSPLDMLEDIIESHGFGRMIFADDIQVYFILKHTDDATLIPRLEQCIIDIKAWSTANDLKLKFHLNSEKLFLSHLLI